jgi:hypothetical protein
MDTCQTCQSDEILPFECNGVNSKTLGKLPTIKKNGFISTEFWDSSCTRMRNGIQFYTDTFCKNLSFEGKSIKFQFNEKTKNAEMIYFKNLNCNGPIDRNDRFPVGRCIETGPSIYLLIKK